MTLFEERLDALEEKMARQEVQIAKLAKGHAELREYLTETLERMRALGQALLEQTK